MKRRGLAAVALAAALVAIALPTATEAAVRPCGPATPVTFRGRAQPEDARTYRLLRFDVAPGTTRVEVTYDWADVQPAVPSTPLTQTVFDLGLWDADGSGAPDGFRGWSGSRAGRSPGQEPIFVQQDVAQRGYLPGPIEPGVWTADLGIAAVGPTGADWVVRVRCTAAEVGLPFVRQPVDRTHVARAEAGWYHGDFHMHGFHSNMKAPEWQEMVDEARSAGLDFLPITDYVTGQHWWELGPVQDANRDVVIWPGREIITYFGHANAIGETPSTYEYRHGLGSIRLRTIQRDTKNDGALFQVNHPTIFPGPVFRNFCRGCEFELGRNIDWAEVDTIEVLTGPVLVGSDQIGLPPLGVQIENPFMRSAIDLWESLLRKGFKIAPVSGSDSKGVEPEGRQWGTSATAVYSSALARPALIEAVEAGHTYVRTRGAEASPEVEVAISSGTEHGIVGDTVHGDRATLSVTVRGGKDQLLFVSRDGDPYGLPVLIDADPFSYTTDVDRVGSSGPLGTFFRVDTADLQSLTTIGGAVFLRRA